MVEIVPPFIETDKGPKWIERSEWNKGLGHVSYEVYASSVVEQLVAWDNKEIGF